MASRTVEKRLSRSTMLLPVSLLKSCILTVCILYIALTGNVSAKGQPLGPEFSRSLQWRMIGPFRGGRTVAACGVPGRPNVFFMAPNNGGVWKSTDYGHTWNPIFDDQPTGSIGALAVAPSNPEVIYAGSGEGLQRPDLSTGDGIYRSNDGGKMWKHLGLRNGQQIPAICVDSGNPNRVFAAVLGHPYGPNPERGVYRSLDGGENWKRVLYRDENTGATEVTFDPRNKNTLYSVLWSGRQAPWEVGSSWDGPGSGLFKSTDGGETWRQLTKGLPSEPGRIGISVSPTDPNRLYALADGRSGGLYRSEDAGESWQRVNAEGRIWGRGSDFAEVRVYPTNPDTVFVANTSTYRSTDGGKNFTAIKGAPGGDDYHRIWINPENPDIILLGVDQGATLTVNGGETWSSWYNQPTAQFYHVITDNRFPYWAYGAQQESGSAGVASRGDYGAITARDWMTVGVEEYGYIAPDPLDPNLLYGGKLTRFDRRTGDVQNVAPEPIRGGKFRYVRTLPVIFSPVDRRALYFGANVVFKTRNGGQSWEIISPDLTRETYAIPPNLGIFINLDPEKGKHRGVIYTLAPSFLDANVLWAGTDDGLIHLTRDGGKTWSPVTPPDLTPWSKVSLMEAGHFDVATAYAAINRFRLDDLRPHIYRTHDGGKIWKEIVRGIPDNEVVNAVREDPVKRWLLFCGTERAVYVSFNDGDDWQPLRLNMPATSIRDLVVHGDDLIVGTHGRSFWILDDITPLRQFEPRNADAPARLFRPQVTVRVRRSRNTDTPLPQEEPMGQNPPDGAILDYWLKDAPKGPVSMELLDSRGRLVRRFTSDDTAEPVDPKELDVPFYWVRQPRILPADAGMHRWVWDLRYPPPNVPFRNMPISAIVHDTPRGPLGPFIAPGRVTVRLTVDGHTFTQTLMVKLDPRIKTPPALLARQYRLSMLIYEGIQRSGAAVRHIQAIREQLGASKVLARGDAAASLAALESKLAGLVPDGTSDTGRQRTLSGEANLEQARGALSNLLELLQSSDRGPTTQATAAAEDQIQNLNRLLHQWSDIEKQDLPAVNERLRASGLPPLLIPNTSA
jgi:photosystem II stability/assembly factor-like uncharacterized protein